MMATAGTIAGLATVTITIMTAAATIATKRRIQLLRPRSNSPIPAAAAGAITAVKAAAAVIIPMAAAVPTAAAVPAAATGPVADRQDASVIPAHPTIRFDSKGH
jgi:hypothetical protein